MAAKYFLFICLALLTVCSAENIYNGTGDGHFLATVEIIENIKAYRAKNADRMILPMELVSRQGHTMRFHRGTPNTGSLLAHVADSRYLGSPQDIKLTLTYPQSGIGAVVTYIVVDVTTSSGIARGYVVAGEIGQRRISIVIEAQSTNMISYDAKIYGSADRMRPFAFFVMTALVIFLSNRQFKFTV